MSSTNKTTNYELSQFIETDKPAWLTDYNGDMRKLDTVLKGVSDVASGASGSISSLTDRMTAAEGAITTNANDIDALEARADALEAGAQSTAGTIANIQAEQTAQNLGIEAATQLGYNLARPYDSASTYAVGDYVLFQNTLYKCVTAIATGEAFDPTKWIAIKATDEISAGGISANYIDLANSDILKMRAGSSSLIAITSNSTDGSLIHLNNVSVSILRGGMFRLSNLLIAPLSVIYNFDNVNYPSGKIFSMKAQFETVFNPENQYFNIFDNLSNLSIIKGWSGFYASMNSVLNETAPYIVRYQTTPEYWAIRDYLGYSQMIIGTPGAAYCNQAYSNFTLIGTV